VTSFYLELAECARDLLISRKKYQDQARAKPVSKPVSKNKTYPTEPISFFLVKICIIEYRDNEIKVIKK